jgi:mono/diheme cytochrome c family protein
MQRGRIILIVVIVIFAAGAWLASRILHEGLSAKAAPTRLETAVARGMRHLAIPSGARALQNPVPDSPQAVREGLLHFADHCATCHANDGSGDTLYGRRLYPKTPDMRLPATQELSDGELFWIVENGVRFTGMPAFFALGEQEASWKLMRFIRHLPQLTPAERAEMERNNPKTPGDLAEEQEEKEFLSGKDSAAKSGAKPQDHH